MLFELFITIYLQIGLLPNTIFQYCGLEFEDDPKLTNNSDIIYYNLGLKYNIKKIPRS